MVNLDSVKLKISNEFLRGFNSDLFNINTQCGASDSADSENKVILYKLNVSKKILGLKDVSINLTKGFSTLELSAKILKENYLDLINLNTIENVFNNLNALEIINLDKSCIDSTEVLRCDVTNNLMLESENKIQSYLLSLSAYTVNNKYQCKVYDSESVVFDKRVKTNSLKEYQTFYYKHPEIKRDKELLKYIDSEYCLNMLRCESKFASFEQMRNAFKIKDLKLIDILNSTENVNLNIFNRITKNIDSKELLLIKNYERLIEMKREIKKSRLYKQFAMLRVLEICNNDIDMIKVFLATNSTANNSKELREFKVLLKSVKDCENNNSIQNDIQEIRNLLQVA